MRNNSSVTVHALGVPFIRFTQNSNNSNSIIMRRNKCNKESKGCCCTIHHLVKKGIQTFPKENLAIVIAASSLQGVVDNAEMIVQARQFMCALNQNKLLLNITFTKWKNGVEVSCQETWPRLAYHDPIKASCSTSVWPKTAYYSLVSVTLFFLPIIVMSIAYALIIGRLWGSKPPGEKLDAALTNQARAKRKVVKMVCIIMLVFIVCWAPLQVLILFAQFSHNSHESGELPEWYDQVMFLVYSIAYTNSTLNPLLYGGLNQTYRKTLIRVLFRKCCQWRAGRDSGLSMQGSLQLAEFRALPQVGLVAHNSSTSTHSTRFAQRGRLINQHPEGAVTAASGYVSGFPRGRLSVQLSSTMETQSLKCQSNLKCQVQVVTPQLPANVSSTVLPLDSGINTEGSELRLAVSRPLRSGSSHRRKHELLG